MADIKLWGATFPDVPKVLLPTATDGTAEFYEVSGSQTVTDNGTYDVKSLSEMVVNVSGGGGDEPDPTDGKTHIWIHIDPDTPANRLTFPLYFGQSVANGVMVDWGDGSATETFAGTSATVHNHTYATGGDYEITLEVTDGTLNLTGTSSSSGYAIYGSKADSLSYNRSRIKRVHIGGGVTSIGQYCFYRCYALKKVSGMGDVTSIGAYAFNNCYVLSSITIPDGVTSIGTYAFSYCYALTNATIPDSVTSIGTYAFYYCYSLSNITIPDSITSIGNSMFSVCYSLSSITIPDSVTNIGSGAFASCFSLTSITIPDSVTSIGNGAFGGCYSMSEYHFKSTTPPTLSNTNVFSNIPSDCIIYVPAESLEAYKTASYWSTYANKMQGE